MKISYLTLIPILILPLALFSQTTIWSEDFSNCEEKGAFGPSNQIDLADITRWSVDVSAANLSAESDYFKVKDGIFNSRDTDGECIWLSEEINISECINISINIYCMENGTLEAADYIRSYYKLDNGQEILFGENTDDFTEANHSISNLNANNTIQIIIKTNNNAGTEYIYFDDIVISGEFIGNYPPQINNVYVPQDNIFPPDTPVISAEINDPDGNIDQAILYYGHTSGNLINTISMQNVSGTLYNTPIGIPQQVHSTTLYYKIIATDNEGSDCHSEEYSYYVYPRIILSEFCDPKNEFSTNRYIEITNLEHTEVILDNFNVEAYGNGAGKCSWNLSGSIEPLDSKICGDDLNTALIPDFINPDWSEVNGYWNGSGDDGAQLRYNDLIIDEASTHGRFTDQSSIRSLSTERPTNVLDMNEWTEVAVTHASTASPAFHICKWIANNDLDWNNAANWNYNNIPNKCSHVIINNDYIHPQSPILAEMCDLGIYNTHFIVGAMSTIDISGDILTENTISPASLTLQSDINGNTSLIINGNSPEECIAERYIPAYSSNSNGWHMISSPVSNMTIAESDFDSGIHNENDLYKFNETINGWENYRQGHFSLFENGLGYMVAVNESKCYQFTGTLNNSDLNFENLSFSENEGNGWHLLGNPFTSSLKWNTSDWDLNSVGGVAKIWNENTGNYTDISQYENIPSSNAFFVRVSSEINNLTIPTSARRHEMIPNYKNDKLDSIPDCCLKIIVSNTQNQFQDALIFGLKEDAQTGYDENFDSYKLFGSTAAPQVALVNNEEMFSTNFIPYQESEHIQTLYLKCANNSQHTLEIIGSDSFMMNDFILEDTESNKLTDLNQDTIVYQFQPNDLDKTDRFRLVLNKSNNIREGKPPHDLIVWVENQVIYVENCENIHHFQVYDCTGRIISSKKNKNNKVEIPMYNQSGIFILRAYDNKGYTNLNVVIM
jgi:hypothetical protein